MDSGRQRLALVAPFFGRELRGRKERFAFDFATHLALAGLGVEVMTTTAEPGAPDANFFHAGIDHTEPFAVHRFRVDPPDRAAYEDAVIASRRADEDAREHRRALLDERVRSPELVAHVRDVADRYDAFLFLDVSVTTTVVAVDAVAERALLVPLLDDDPVVRLPAVADAVARARMILCTTEAEAALLAQIFGPSARMRTRVIGMGTDTVPAAELRANRVDRVTSGRPFVLATGSDRNAIAAMRSGGQTIVVLDDVDERDRAAFFTYARAVAVTGVGMGFAPEVIEAWSYRKPVLAAENAPGAALLVRAIRGGIVIGAADWAEAVRTLPSGDALDAMARDGEAYVAQSGGWEGVAAQTSAAIDGLAAVDDGRSRDALLAQVAYLYPLAQRQRRTIEAMRVSRFWRLRDAWFTWRKRFGKGPEVDPVPVPAAGDRAVELAALGDPYQLFRQQHRLRIEDVERMRAMTRFMPRALAFALVIDTRRGEVAGVAPTLRSLREQIYTGWNARVLLGDGIAPDELAALEAIAGEDARITLVPPGGDRFGEADFVGALEPHDRLERHALFDLALILQDDVDVVYSDEDRLDDQGVASNPWFKPDWSPDTLLTRDYVGRLCMMRRTIVDRVGGVRDVFESAAWYEALLRVTEVTSRIEHVAEILCHRGPRNGVANNDLALAVEVALRRRGEDATTRIVPEGVDVRFASADERVCVVIPTRDRADLLRPCIASLFERTSHQAFEVIVVDNGSRQAATLELLSEWERREPGRFRVLRDPAPFNYSRINNAAVRATDAPYVVLLNNDTEVISPDWIDAMLGQARRPGIGAVGALLLYGDGTVQHSGIVLGILGLAGHAHRFSPGTAPGYHGALQLDTNYLAVTGACLMVARSRYEEVGGLDESMAVAYNDVDFCLKLRRAGYRNVFVSRARLHHYESKSRGADDTPRKVAQAMREIDAIRVRWPGWSVRDPFYNPNLTADAEDFGFRL